VIGCNSSIGLVISAAGAAVLALVLVVPVGIAVIKPRSNYICKSSSSSGGSGRVSETENHIQKTIV
jgi:hypothetical protein